LKETDTPPGFAGADGVPDGARGRDPDSLDRTNAEANQSCGGGV